MNVFAFYSQCHRKLYFSGGTVVKNLPANAGDTGDVGLIPGSGRFPGEGNGNLLHSCLGNPMDREAWQATVHGVTEIPTQLSTHHTTSTQEETASKG